VSTALDRATLAWRITSQAYAESAFDGEGARRYGGRWNSEGTRMTYLAGSLALATLEQLAHLSRAQLLERQFVRFRVEIPSASILELDGDALPPRWTQRLEATRALGDGWAEAKDAPVLRVPSAVVPEESNYLLNPVHPETDRLDIGSSEPFVFDERLLGAMN
jgi:RES domain-containing protein